MEIMKSRTHNFRCARELLVVFSVELSSFINSFVQCLFKSSPGRLADTEYSISACPLAVALTVQQPDLPRPARSD